MFKYLNLLVGFLFVSLLATGCCCMEKLPCAGGGCCGKKMACAEKSCKGGMCDKSQCPFESCLMKSTCCALKKKEELGLSEEQATKIKDLGAKTKKEVIQLKADSEKIGVDLKTAISADDFDTVTINGLIDKNVEVRKQTMKTIVNSHAELLALLTPEQKTKLKEVVKNCKGKECCSEGECSDCKKPKD